MGASPRSNEPGDGLWPIVALIVALVAGCSVLGCIDATPIVLPPEPGPVVVDPVDPIIPTPAPVDDWDAPADAIPYATIEQITEGMTEADLIATLGTWDDSSDSTRVWRNAQNRDGKARELRVDIQAGLVTGRSLWRTKR